MKLFIAFGIALCALLIGCNGYSHLIPAKLHRPGVCMYHGLILQRGDNSIPSSCQNMHCNDDGSILVEGCGHYDMRDCRIIDPMHLGEPYPNCCKMNFLCNTIGGPLINRIVSPVDRRVYA